MKNFIFALVILFGGLAGFILWGLREDIANNWRYTHLFPVFEIFNAHLKDVCTEREIKDECPHNESELASYKPEHYSSLKKQTKTYYSFNFLTQQHTFAIEYGDHIYVSHDDFYPAQGWLTPDEAREKYGVVFPH